MIPHKISIGEIIFDERNRQWGVVCVLHSANSGLKSIDLTNEMTDTIIGYTPCEWNGEEWVEEQGYCETTADLAYPHLPNRYFWDCDVCIEINRDEYDENHQYDFYCPTRNENCYDFEVS